MQRIEDDSMLQIFIVVNEPIIILNFCLTLTDSDSRRSWYTDTRKDAECKYAANFQIQPYVRGKNATLREKA